MLTLRRETASIPHNAPATPHDDTLMTREEFFAKIARAEQEELRGEGVVITSDEELTAFLDGL